MTGDVRGLEMREEISGKQVGGKEKTLNEIAEEYI